MCVFFFHGCHEKKRKAFCCVTGKRHNSLGSNPFFPRRLLGASLVQQRDRLKKREKNFRRRADPGLKPGEKNTINIQTKYPRGSKKKKAK